ncbi:hypothetical protein HYN69_01250 [Gemmobacter aquarius]|uniref:Lipoprotein LPP20-like domain-containing protein n=1 Tax=Paragemmobacter aquarius TaxID=2169400 RepID=A0A2S0UQR6_9RHOB|nr:LPP20 family lipoprotein [Gemmobacter aquarius]AWB50154.1 hypothetical protein HYN69_01250 [Gemmobacter aquarius]
MRSIFLLVPLALMGCATAAPTAKSALPLDARENTVQLAGIKDDLDAADRLAAPAVGGSGAAAVVAPPMMFAPDVPSLKGLGFAQIAGQPGKTQNEKRLMAIRAARVDALRDLTEQVHGVRISGTTTVRDAVVADDSLNAVVQGTLRGARTLRVTASGSDSYEVEMELDRDTVAYIVRALKGRI